MLEQEHLMTFNNYITQTCCSPLIAIVNISMVCEYVILCYMIC